MMRKLLLALGLLLAAALPCAAQPTGITNWLDWYFIMADTNPATTVFQTSTGISTLANSNGTYQTWLQGGNAPVIGTITGAVTNGGPNLCRLTVGTTAQMTTGEVVYVSQIIGATGCNVVATITVINSTTIDLQGTTFGGTYTAGGVVSGPTYIATIASLLTALNNFALVNLPNLYGTNTQTSAVDITLTNPMVLVQNVTMSAGSKVLNLPSMQMPNSLPLGVTLTIANQGATNSFAIKDSTGSTLLAALGPLQVIFFSRSASGWNQTFSAVSSSGTGALVYATSAALVTPTLGAATATSLQIGPTAPSGNNLVQVDIASATARFFSIKNTAGEGLYGVDASGAVYAWAVTGTTVFGTATNVDVNFYVNNSIQLFSLKSAATLALSSIAVKSTLAATSATAASLTVAGGLGVTGTIYAAGIASASGNDILCYTTASGLVTYAVSVVGCVPSAMRFKDALAVYDDRKALDGLMSLDVGIYSYKADTGLDRKPMIGLYADQVCRIDLRLCHHDKDGLVDNYDKIGLTALIVGAVQQLKADNDNLRSEIDALKRRRN